MADDTPPAFWPSTQFMHGPPVDRNPHILEFRGAGRFHYLEGDKYFADGWYYDCKMWLGDYEPKEYVRYGPIPFELLEPFVREHEHMLKHRVEDVLAYLRRETDG